MPPARKRNGPAAKPCPAGRPDTRVALSFMSDPAENPISPAPASVWPPPPLSAPETFKVEGVSLTKHGDQLFLVKHKALKSSPHSLLTAIIFFGVLWLNSLHTWISSHHQFGPLYVIWNNPSFRWAAIIKAVVFAILALAWTWFIWDRNAGSGRALINRHTKTMEVGNSSGAIKSVTVSSLRPFLFTRYFVLLNLHIGSSITFGGMQTLYYFRQKESAERVARKIADFLDVPLRDLSAGTKG